MAWKIFLDTLEMWVLSHIIRDKEILASELRCRGVKTPLFSHQNLQETENDTIDFSLLSSSYSRFLQNYFPLTPTLFFFPAKTKLKFLVFKLNALSHPLSNLNCISAI